MKRYRFAYTLMHLLLLFTSACFSQTIEEKIQHIKQVYSAINSDSNFKIKMLENEEYQGRQTSDGGGELKGYYKGYTLLKITCWTGISSGTIQDEFYFENGKLIFTYVRENHFNLTDTSLDGHYKTKLVFEGRYYFKSDRCFKINKKGNPFSSAAQPDDDFVTLLLEEAKNYSSMLAARGYKSPE